ncbi:MAG TPA: cell wall-binding repeat-containing protein, partial [Euzebya sp.]|nr:cell wall-binding repeat-containing protein [Euzebya sp.]
SRDDNFADALASGLLQREAPLLLVPSQGPVPDRILAEIQRLGAGRATILGGTGAVSAAVADQLSGGGIVVDRRFGGSRIETAIDIARFEAPDATTAIMARAFPSNPDDPTQGFADALGAGAMAAERSWPILLSDTGSLTAATRAYLADSDITEIKLIGGTAALSADVEFAINGMGIATERLAGPTRGSTALEISKELGADSAADVAHVILVDGTAPDGWAGGFASARRAAELNAPILLADGVRLLPESEAFLEPGSTFAQAGDLTVTCVVHPLACTEGRRALGLVDYPLLSVDPPRGARVDPGQPLAITLTPVEEGAGVEVFLEGTCLTQPQDLVTDAQGQAVVTLATSFDNPQCQLTTTYSSTDEESFNRSTVTYVTEGPGARTAADAFIASEVLAFGSVVPDQPVIVNDTVSCTPPGGGAASRDAWAMQAQDQQPGAPAFDTVNIGSEPLTTAPDAACTISITPPPEATRVFWGLYSVYDVSLRVPLLLGTGNSASFDLGQVAADTGADPRDLAVRWIVQVDTPTPSAPQPAPPGPEGLVNNVDGLDVVCDGESVPAGQFIIPVGAQCTASVANPAFNVLLIQPDRPNVSASTVSFSPLAETRWTTVRAQLLYQEQTPGQGGADCQSAMPLEIGRQSGGAVSEPFERRYHRFEAQAGEAFRIRLDAAVPDEGFDPLLTLVGPGGSMVDS